MPLTPLRHVGGNFRPRRKLRSRGLSFTFAASVFVFAFRTLARSGLSLSLRDFCCSSRSRWHSIFVTESLLVGKAHYACGNRNVGAINEGCHCCDNVADSWQKSVASGYPRNVAKNKGCRQTPSFSDMTSCLRIDTACAISRAPRAEEHKDVVQLRHDWRLLRGWSGPALGPHGWCELR